MKLVITLIFLFTHLNAMSIEAERFGFEIELDQKQLERVVDYYDFNSIDKLRTRINFHITPDQYSGYLLNIDAFKALPKGIQEELIKEVTKTSNVKEGLKELSKESPKMTSALKLTLRKIDKIWFDKYSIVEKKDHIEPNLLPKNVRAFLFLVFPEELKFKDDLNMPLKLKKLFKHINVFKDQEAIEFNYLYDYKVTNKEQFLDELNSIAEFLKVDHLLQNPLATSNETLSLHIHLSGEALTQEYLKKWNSKILLDNLLHGEGIDMFGMFGYESDINKKGFVRHVSTNHIELRNLTSSPKHTLSLEIKDIEKSIIDSLTPSPENLRHLVRLSKISPESLGHLFSENLLLSKEVQDSWNSILNDPNISEIQKVHFFEGFLSEPELDKNLLPYALKLLDSIAKENHSKIAPMIIKLSYLNSIHIEIWKKMVNKDIGLSNSGKIISQFLGKKPWSTDTLFLWESFKNSESYNRLDYNEVLKSFTAQFKHNTSLMHPLLSMSHDTRFDMGSVEIMEDFFKNQRKWDEYLEEVADRYVKLAKDKYNIRLKLPAFRKHCIRTLLDTLID